jgi:hypothetical protein
MQELYSCAYAAAAMTGPGYCRCATTTVTEDSASQYLGPNKHPECKPSCSTADMQVQCVTDWCAVLCWWMLQYTSGACAVFTALCAQRQQVQCKAIRVKCPLLLAGKQSVHCCNTHQAAVPCLVCLDAPGLCGNPLTWPAKPQQGRHLHISTQTTPHPPTCDDAWLGLQPMPPRASTELHTLPRTLPGVRPALNPAHHSVHTRSAHNRTNSPTVIKLQHNCTTHASL